MMVNRAAVVAAVLGFEHDESLTLRRPVAGLNAYSKGVSLGFFQPTPRELREQRKKMRKEETVTVNLLHRASETYRRKVASAQQRNLHSPRERAEVPARQVRGRPGILGDTSLIWPDRPQMVIG